MSNFKDVARAAVLSLALAGTLVAVGTGIDGQDNDLVRARFASAAPLVEGNQVKIDGVVVGTVETLTVRDGVAEVSMDLDDKAMPLHEDAHLTIRPVSLLGERYIDLDRGNPSTPALAEDEMIPLQRTSTSVGLDEVLNTVDDPTGEGLKGLVTTLGEGMRGNGAKVDQALRALAPNVQETQKLAEVLSQHNQLLGRLVDNFEPVAGALATRDGKAMERLIASSDRVLSVVRERQGDLDETLKRLPGTLRTLRSTLGHLRSTAGDTTPTLAELRPMTDRLPEISGELQRFSDALDPALADSQPVLDKAKALLHEAAPVADAARRAGPGLARTTDGVRRLAGELTRNRQDLFDWVRYWALTTNGRDGLSHYFRVNVSLNPATLTGLIPGGDPKSDGKPSTTPAPSPGKGADALPDLLNDPDGLLNLPSGKGGDRSGDKGGGSPTGLSKKQEHNLVDMLLGGQ